MGKLVVSYERSVTFHIMFIPRRDLACKLVEKFSSSLTGITFVHMNRPLLVVFLCMKLLLNSTYPMIHSSIVIVCYT